MIVPPPDLALPVPQAGDYGDFGAPRLPPVRLDVVPLVPTIPANAPRIAPPVAILQPPVAKLPAYLTPDSSDRVTVPQTAPVQPDTGKAAELVASNEQLAGPRVGATRLANPAKTVPQGTVILAVLETALASDRPGFVRAIVSRDVRSFDGSRVLIPRGSRLFGEYKADLAQGQSRALVLWQRLTRPDGVQIALDSPAADPLGRAGIGGKVNTHFFQRFAGAIMQSALDIGVGIATRSATNGTVVVGLPGSTQTLINPQAEAIKPTLSVRNGTSVSVFVARDLDFSSVD
jgi:type IV secretion system protein VirB10